MSTPQARRHAEKMNRKSGRCAICGWQPPNGCKTRILDVHHLKHRAYGGTDALKNLILICKNCHAVVHAFDVKADNRVEFILKMHELCADTEG